MEQSTQKPKLCFVVGPIGDDESEDRIHADWLLEEIIEPVFNKYFDEYRVERADRITIPGRIDAQVISALLEADLVIADLTMLNPNAFYEIGIRHMTQKPVIHVHLEGQRIPFDVASFRSIKFSRTRPRDLKAARAALKDAVAAASHPDHTVDNPVTFARGKVVFAEDATPRERVLQDQIDDLRLRVNYLSQNRYSNTKANSDSLKEFGIPNFRITVKTEDGKSSEVRKDIESIIDIYLDDYLIETRNSSTLFIDTPADQKLLSNNSAVLRAIAKNPLVKNLELPKL